MHTPSMLAAALIIVSSATFAAPEQYMFIDDSSPMLIDTQRAVAVWKAQVDDSMRKRLQRLYPVSKWGFISQVQGGFTPDGACVVTASAVMVPRVLGSRLVFKPHRSATAFATQAGATQEQCRELASAKLKEAILGVRSALIADRT